MFVVLSQAIDILHVLASIRMNAIFGYKTHKYENRESIYLCKRALKNEVHVYYAFD